MSTRKELFERVRERNRRIAANQALMYRQWWRPHRRLRRETREMLAANLVDLDLVAEQRRRYGRNRGV